MLAVTVVPVMCYLLFRPWQGSRKSARILAGVIGVATTLITHTFITEAFGAEYLNGWPTAIAIGIMAAVAVVRMTRERFLPLEQNRVSRGIAAVYVPMLRWVLDHKRTFMLAPTVLLIFGLLVWRQICREFMPPLDEGSFLYMPSLLPQASLTQTLDVIGKQDQAIAAVPEVESVVGKLGRADSALDPAPIGMIETIVNLKPEHEWRTIRSERWHSGLPEFLKYPFNLVWPEERSITKAEILEELRQRTDIPAFTSAAEVRAAVVEAGLRRIRPCLMTIATTSFGLLPIFWSTGRGSDVMQPMAMPLVGGMTVSIITLFIVPCLFCAVEEWKLRRRKDGPGAYTQVVT